MKPASFLLGLAIGVAAIVFAWSRGSGAQRDEALATGPPRQESLAARPPAGLPAAAPQPARAEPAGQAPPPGAAGQRVGVDDVEALRARALLIPVEGLQASDLRDDFDDPRAGYAHEALDMLAPRGTRVLAADDGFVAKLFTSARGGITVYQFDPTQSWCYYYAHLDRYASGLREGQVLRKGDLVGFVGTTGNAPPQTPHLHFAIFRLGSEKRWWEGVAVNPYPVLAAPR